MKRVSQSSIASAILNNTIRYKEQINSILKMHSLTLKVLFPFRNVLNFAVKIRLCEAFVLSQFNYYSSIYYSVVDQQVYPSNTKNSEFLFKIDIWRTQIWPPRLNTFNRLYCLYLCHMIVVFKTLPHLYNKIKYRCDVHNIIILFRSFTQNFRFQQIFLLRLLLHVYNAVSSFFEHLSPATFQLTNWTMLKTSQ